MKYVLSLITVLIGSTAMATPGDTACTGIAGGKYAIDMLIGYDNHDSDVDLLEVTVNGVKEFSSTEVVTGMVNVGTDEEPFLNGSITAVSGNSSAAIRIPEQDASSSTFEVYLNVNIENGLTATDVLMTCEL